MAFNHYDTSLLLQQSGLPETFVNVEKKQELDSDQLPEPEYLDEEITGPMKAVAAVQHFFEKIAEKYEKNIKWGAFVIVVILFHVWLGEFFQVFSSFW